MEDGQIREQFDTGVKKIRHELRSLLAQQGLFGTIVDADHGGDANSEPPRERSIAGKLKAVVSELAAPSWQTSSRWWMK
jgi:hypothetical protein